MKIQFGMTVSRQIQTEVSCEVLKTTTSSTYRTNCAIECSQRIGCSGLVPCIYRGQCNQRRGIAYDVQLPYIRNPRCWWRYDCRIKTRRAILYCGPSFNHIGADVERHLSNLITHTNRRCGKECSGTEAERYLNNLVRFTSTAELGCSVQVMEPRFLCFPDPDLSKCT